MNELLPPKRILIVFAAGAAVFCACLAPSPGALLYFAALCLLFLIAWIDARTQEIYDLMSLALAVCGVLAIFVIPQVSLSERLAGAGIGSLPALAFSLLTRGGVGLGDVFLLAAAGLLLGWRGMLSALIIGCLLGGAFAALLLLTKRRSRKDSVPFAPPLCIGVAAALFLPPFF
ncbi:MAG: A24 family peptidase [Clostridiales bacterium]|nr:A24 family peptidase [Clostridiales bacterium]